MLLMGAVLLAAVLATAGIAKLLDLEGSRSAVEAFGIPSRLAGALGTLLPVAELGAAVLLVAAVLSVAPVQAGAFSALFLLGLFSAAIAASLVRGRAPDCHCFGQLHSAPAGPPTLGRNGALLVVAAFVATEGDPVPTAIAGAAALVMFAVVFGASRGQVTEPAAQRGTEGLPVGSPAPGFRVPGLDGGDQTLESLRGGGRSLLLLFTDPGCGPCIELAPEVARWQRRHRDELTIAVIEQASNGVPPAGVDQHGRINVVLQRDGEVSDLYRVQGTPTAVLVGGDGAIASPVVGGREQIMALMAQTVRGFEAPGRNASAARLVLGGQVRRRELLVRMAAAWAATSAVLAWPLRAAAIASGRTPRAADPRCRDKFDCPHRDGFADCVNGRCRCGDAHTYCSHEEADPRHCFDLQSSRDHCGACNHECTGADHDVCCEGQCGEFGQTRCNCGGGEPCPGEHDVCGEGIDPGTYFCFNCADFGWQRCGNECADPKTHRCCGNKIYSKDKLPPGDWRCCGPEDRRQLVNVQENEQHCGSCNKRCPEGQFCFGGRCRTRCPSGLKRCGNTCGDARRHTCCHGKLYAKADRVRECKGRCISTKSDQKNCGDCGRKCNGPFDTGECCNGKCCDINADTCCPGGCKNLDHDEGNCGGCGNICVPPMKCRFGTCYCPPGENCN